MRRRNSGGMGLSPRMRGNLIKPPGVKARGRSIPAYAGEPPSRYAKRYAAKVYPRVCGGTASGDAGPAPRRGLSPRMRGNRRR